MLMVMVRILLAAISIAATASGCRSPGNLQEEQNNTQTPQPATAVNSPVANTLVPVGETPTQTAAPTPQESCAIGLGLRQETVEILLAEKDHPGFVMSANMHLATTYFPELSGWIRTLGAPSLEELETKAIRALDLDLDFEALSYGLETSVTTPEAEWRNLVEATQQAREIADSFGKQLVMGPGFRLMSENEDRYPAMAAQSSIWMIQTQRLQTNPPGEEYRREVERIVDLIRSGNPEILVWAQINFLPGQTPDAEEWLAYRESIIDLVDGTYIGIYIWDTEDPEVLIQAVNQIFTLACQ
jgi:hypothetical protein